MFYVKLMDEKHDGFKIIEVENLQYIDFSRIGENDFHSEENGPGDPIVTLNMNIDGSERISFYPLGDTYVLNEKGQTISRFPRVAPAILKP